MEAFLFYFFSGIAILGAFLVILLPKPTRALLSLVSVMFALTVLYLLLGAPFVAMANLIVYAGAVLVLFLFVIMLQGVGAIDTPLKDRFSLAYLGISCFVAVSFMLLTLFVLLKGKNAPLPTGVEGSAEAIGMSLFGRYLLPFELVSILILVGVFAALALAKKEEGS